MLQTVLCSSLPIVTVATFDRQKLPSLPLASNPVVASRFHTIMNRFQGEVAQAPSTTLTPEEHPQDAVADPKVEAGWATGSFLVIATIGDGTNTVFFVRTQ